MRTAISGPGVIQSPDGKCSVTLTIAPYGGYDVLSYGEPRGQVEDVTAVVWISPARLAYSVSPIYGKPGIYIFDCTNKSTVQIMGPKTRNSASPDGADYFELKEVRDGQILRFYYAPDVEKMDAAHLRRPSNLFSIRIDGSGFRRALVRKK